MIRRLFMGIMLAMLVACQPNTAPKTAEPALKRIALTYDDAPRGDGPRYTGVERTAAMLEQFETAETGPVAIFVTTRGMDLPQGEARIASYAAAGHRIANHSDQHAWASRTLTDEYIADIDRAEAKLSGYDNRRPWFRFPFLDEGGQGEANQDGIKRDALRRALAERDLISGYVTIDTYDWHLDRLWTRAVQAGHEVDMQKLSEIYVAMVVDAATHYDALSQRVLDRRPAQVLLLHENDLAASFTVDLVDALRADGWTIIDPDEAFADPIVDQLPKTRYSGGGRISALAFDAGLTTRGDLDHWSVNETAIDDRVEAGRVFTPNTQTQ